MDLFRQTVELMNVNGWTVHPVLTLLPLGERAPENCLRLQELTRIVIDDNEQPSDRIDALRKLADADAEDHPLLAWDASKFILGMVKLLELTVKHIVIAEAT